MIIFFLTSDSKKGVECYIFFFISKLKDKHLKTVKTNYLNTYLLINYLGYKKGGKVDIGKKNYGT